MTHCTPSHYHGNAAIIKRFGLEVILLYVAILLRKRVVVHCATVAELLEVMRALPALAWHRQDWTILRPHVLLTSEPELEELRGLPTYCAGFTEPECENHDDLYDLFVSFASDRIVVAEAAKEAFGLGKLHKEIAVFLSDTANNDELSEAQTIKAIALKTADLINGLKGMAGEGGATGLIRQDDLRDKGLSPAVQGFLWNLAIAEGLAQL